MNSKKKIMIVFISISLLIIFSNNVAGEKAKLEITSGPTYHLYELEDHPKRYYYKINLTIQNSGEGISEKTLIKIVENGNKIYPEEYQDLVIQPGEKKDISIDWNTGFQYKTIEIIYEPSDINILKNDDNSGNVTLDISGDQKGDDNIPGFNFSTLIFIIILSGFFIYKKKRNIDK